MYIKYIKIIYIYKKNIYIYKRKCISLISLKWATKKHSLRATSEADPNKELTYRKTLQSYSELIL